MAAVGGITGQVAAGRGRVKSRRPRVSALLIPLQPAHRTASGASASGILPAAGAADTRSGQLNDDGQGGVRG